MQDSFARGLLIIITIFILAYVVFGICEEMCYTYNKKRFIKGEKIEIMGLLPMDIDILPPSDDRIFKKILISPEATPVLIDLISSIINRQVMSVVVRNNELPVEDTEEKAERLDVNCSIGDGTQIDLEIQASHIKEISGEHKNLKGKSIYYLCDLHSSQPSKGIKRYDELVQTFQVTFCAYTIFPKFKNYVNTFSLRHDITNDLLSDVLRVVYVELSKLNKILKKPVPDMTDLEKWALFFQYSPDPKYREILNKVIESKEELKMAGNLLMSISKDERERAIFRSRRMYQSDLESNLATVKELGRREGIEIGKIEGKSEGETTKALSIANEMIRDKIPIDVIIKYTKLTLEEVEKLRGVD